MARSADSTEETTSEEAICAILNDEAEEDVNSEDLPLKEGMLGGLTRDETKELFTRLHEKEGPLEESDIENIARALYGKEKIFYKLYNRDSAADYIQGAAEKLVRFLRHPENVQKIREKGGYFSAYSDKAVKRKAIDNTRSEARRKEDPLEERENDDYPQVVSLETLTTAATQHDEYLTKITEQDIHELIQDDNSELYKDLEPIDRAIVKLKWQGMTSPEIAAALDKTDVFVRQHLKRYCRPVLQLLFERLDILERNSHSRKKLRGPNGV